MATPYQGFCGPSYVSQAKGAANELCMNYYCERTGVESSRTQYSLLPTPGGRLLATLATSPGYGCFFQTGRLFAVAGASLVEIDATWSPTVRGAVTEDGRPVTFSTSGDAGKELFVVVGRKGGILDLTTNVFTPNVVTNVDIGGYLDTIFLGLDINTSTVVMSDPADGLTWDPLQFFQRSDASDPWRSMIVRAPEIWLIGEKTGSVWYNAGGFPIPFAPIQGAQIQVGIAAPFTLKWLNGPVWLAQSEEGFRTVVRAQGYTPVRISDYGVERALSQYGDVSAAEATVYEEGGHRFYVLTIPNEATWVYDDTENMWHQRGSLNVSQTAYDAWKARGHSLAFGKRVMMDRTSGGLYEVNVDIGTDVGNTAEIRRVRRPPSPYKDPTQRISEDMLALDMEVGQGVKSGQGVDPTMLLRTSNDLGSTWGPYRPRSTGARGKWQTQVVWNQLGDSFLRQHEFVSSDPVPWRITGAWLEAAE